MNACKRAWSLTPLFSLYIDVVLTVFRLYKLMRRARGSEFRLVGALNLSLRYYYDSAI